MIEQLEGKKPKTILHAEYALWAWTAWICLFGTCQSWASIPDIEKMIADQAQGIFMVSPKMLLEVIIASYAMLALASSWIVFRIGAGKGWARTSLLIGFIMDVLWTAWPPYQGLGKYLSDIPDLGLQSYALYLLYTWPGYRWFERSETALKQ